MQPLTTGFSNAYLHPPPSLGTIADLEAITEKGGDDLATVSNTALTDPNTPTPSSSDTITAVTFLCAGLQENARLEVFEDPKKEHSSVATHSLVLLFLKALGSLEQSPENAASLQGCMQVLHLRLQKDREFGMSSMLALVHNLSNVATPVPFGHLRLLFLSLLYNSTSEVNAALRLHILIHAIHLSARACLTKMLLPSLLPRIPELVSAWKPERSQLRNLYDAVTAALESAGSAFEAYEWNVKFIETFDGESGAVLNEARVKNAAKKALLEGIKLKNMFRFDALMEMDAIRNLKDDKTCSALYRLSEVFVNGDVHKYLTWHKDVVTKNGGRPLGEIHSLEGLEHSMCLEKIRLLTFCSMGIEAQEMSYQQVVGGLGIEKSDVEEWVIRAISAGLVDAKVNQLDEKVRIYRSTQRTFTRAEWQPLSERINMWKANVADLLEALKATRKSSRTAADSLRTEMEPWKEEE